MYEFKVEGLTCGSCATAVRRALARLDEKIEAAVDLSKQTVTVRSDHSATELMQQIEKAGYAVLQSRELAS